MPSAAPAYRRQANLFSLPQTSPPAFKDNKVTVRNRDNEEQDRISISDLKEHLENYYK